MRAWVRVGDLVHRWSRGALRLVALPLRVWWVGLDRLLWVWWAWGQGYDGAARWRWYRAMEDRYQRLYDAVYYPLVAVIAREIGE